jgi:predicted  nucleic acid-binding Zn-ribbon protein
MVPKTVLAVALLLLLAFTVDAASPPQWIREVVTSTGPYEYQWGGYPVLLSWFSPHAVPINLTFLNVTWWKPHSVWFKGTYYARVCGRGCDYRRVTIYVAQRDLKVVNPLQTNLGPAAVDYIEYHIKQICRQGTAMVAPAEIIVLDSNTQIWISDVYCLYYNQWYWLRLLPYDFLLYGYLVRDAELVNATDLEVRLPVEGWRGTTSGMTPAGWYLHPVTKEVFRIPGANLTLLAELQRAERRIYELQSLLENKTALLASANLTIAQLNETVARLKALVAQLNSTTARLNAALAEARGEAARLAAENKALRTQLETLNTTRVRLEAEVNVYRTQLETLRAEADAYRSRLELLSAVETQLAQLTAENQALKAQIASMNETLAKLNEAYASQTAQLRHQLETWTRAAWIGAALGAAAGAAAAALALRRRK